MELESVDIDYWHDEDLFTVWQAAFLMCDIEPWDEPISSNAKPPTQVEKMRMTLLANIPHYQTKQIFAQSGWSCKSKRPAQLSGLYFSQEALIDWSARSLAGVERPLFLAK